MFAVDFELLVGALPRVVWKIHLQGAIWLLGSHKSLLRTISNGVRAHIRLDSVSLG